MSRSRKIDELDSTSSVGLNDQLVINQPVSNTAWVVNNVTVDQLFSHIPTGIVVSVDQIIVRQSSAPTIPLTSNTASLAGTIWWDTDYLYIAVADDTVKRVALTSF